MVKVLNDNFDLETSHVLPALIKRCLGGENPFEVWGSPDVVRDFIYVIYHFFTFYAKKKFL